jgi:hypothetical protein
MADDTVQSYIVFPRYMSRMAVNRALPTTDVDQSITKTSKEGLTNLRANPFLNGLPITDVPYARIKSHVFNF